MEPLTKSVILLEITLSHPCSMTHFTGQIGKIFVLGENLNMLLEANIEFHKITLLVFLGNYEKVFSYIVVNCKFIFFLPGGTK